MAGLLVAVPLLRASRGEASPQTRAVWWLGAAIVVGIAAAAVGLYAWIGTPSAIGTSSEKVTAAGQPPHPETSGTAAGGTALSMDEATARLAARLAAEGGTRADWQLLAQSYDFLGRAEEATAARERANAAPGKAHIQGSVDIGPGLRGRAVAGDTLYIYAKQIGAGGPPLAVLRVSADRWPVSFALDDSNAMVPGRDLSHADKVLLEARVSRSGNAIPQSGDLVGTIEAVDPRAGQPVRIVIDHVF